MTKPLVNYLGYMALTATALSTLAGCSTMKGWVQPLEEAIVSTDSATEPSKEETVKQFESTRDKALLSAADARWLSNDVRGCEATLMALLSRSPDCVAAQLMLADLYAATDRIELAEDQLKMALNQYPKNADVQHAMALVLEQKGDVVGAGQHFDAAIRLDPRNELFKLSQETTSAAIRSMNEEASSVVLATANIPVFSGAEGASEGLTLRFNDSDNTSSNQTQLDPQLDYPETAVGGPGIEERVEELKAILESMPTENEESNKSLSKRQPMIRLPS